VVGTWDRLHLETAVENLLSNATKFGAGKPIDVTIERDTSHARLHVRDWGIGISSEQRARVFQRFERAVPEQHYGGLGLGLWTVRQIVEAHRGAVRVDSATGEGSTFTLELPFYLEASA
jgi:signal transduction histidine kinase